jgi:hypothetical protein
LYKITELLEEEEEEKPFEDGNVIKEFFVVAGMNSKIKLKYVV